MMLPAVVKINRVADSNAHLAPRCFEKTCNQSSKERRSSSEQSQAVKRCEYTNRSLRDVILIKYM